MLKPLLFVPFLALAGLVDPGWLGVMLDQEATRPTVSEVVPDSPAAKAGIKAGDVIVAVDDVATDTVETLVATVGGREAGSKVKLKVQRDGKEQVIAVELGKRPDNFGAPPGGGVRVAPPVKEGEAKKEGAKKEEVKKEEVKAEKVETKDQVKTGLAPRDGKPAGRPYLGVALEETDGGVAVTEVMDGSPAHKAGIEKGRLVSIGDHKIGSLADVDKVMGGLSAGQTVKISVRHGDATEAVDVQLGAGAAAKGSDKAAGAEASAKKAAEKAKTAERTAKVEAKDGAAAVKATDKTDKPAKTDVRAELREAKGKPVLLVFGASWDSSTKALKKSIADDKVQAALGERKVVWVDTDQHGQIADEHNVQQIPHMVLLDASGKRTGVIEGFQPAEMLAEKLSQPQPAAAAQARAPQAKTDKPAEKKPAADAKPGTDKKPAAGTRDLQDEIRSLREEVRELRALLQELTKERRR